MVHMTLNEVRTRFLAFYKERGHAIIPSARLVPENDPTTLFTGSGMQPLVPYLLGAAHPEGRRIADAQKAFRAEDIDEVGDNRHTTFFEMLGNWSLGDYFKEEQLPWFFAFLTSSKEEGGVGLDPSRLYVTVFGGDDETGISADEDSVAIWKKLFAGAGVDGGDPKYVALGSEAHGGEVGMQGGRIFSYDVKKNWWSRAGVPSNMPTGEPGGPDSEVFYDFGEFAEDGTTPRHDSKFGVHCHPNCDCGRFLEIGNSVFMEYRKREDGSFEKLAQRNVDFGGGLERITAASIGNADVFAIDVFQKMKDVLGVQNAGHDNDALRKMRVVLDHLRGAVFLIGDGVLPSNKGQGYVLRKLLRRAALFSQSLSPREGWREAMVDVVCDYYAAHYPDLGIHRAEIAKAIADEFRKFGATVKEGLKEFEKRAHTAAGATGAATITGKDAFDLYQSYGFPWELTQEIATERGIAVHKEEFEAEFTKHRDLSRTASAGVFKGGLADASAETTRLHTTHHLLLKALQMVLGPQVKQRGSNITAERLRLDFSYDGGKLTDEQKKEVERIVNENIAEDLPVTRSEMPREEAEMLGAEHEFGAKYPERVSVYSVGPKGATVDNPQFAKAFSIEFCGGPHVTHTGEIGGTFHIVKEESVSAGVRRIRGVIINA